MVTLHLVWGTDRQKPLNCEIEMVLHGQSHFQLSILQNEICAAIIFIPEVSLCNSVTDQNTRNGGLQSGRSFSQSWKWKREVVGEDLREREIH